MLTAKRVTLLLVATSSAVCQARQISTRLESHLESNKLEKSRVAEKTGSRPVDMEALFWSYFHRGSVERAGLFTGGYSRASPNQWEGEASMGSNLGDKVMVLGEMARVSEGPRRRKRETKRPHLELKEVNKLGEFVSQTGWTNGVRLKHEEGNVKQTENRQGKDIFPSTMFASLPRGDWRACTRLCDGDQPPPGFPLCCKALQLRLKTEPSTNWGDLVDATEHFVDSYPLAVIAIQTVFSIAVINVLVSRLSGGEKGVSGRSWENQDQEEEGERLLLQVSDGNWLSSLEEHAMEKRKRENYICCLLNDGEEEQVECFTQPQHSSREQLKFRFVKT